MLRNQLEKMKEEKSTGSNYIKQVPLHDYVSGKCIIRFSSKTWTPNGIEGETSQTDVAGNANPLSHTLLSLVGQPL